MSQTKAIHLALKQTLKEKGITYETVALWLDLSESSVKRLFANGQLSLDRIELICEQIHISLFDLLERIHDKQTITQLSIEQESELIQQPKLLLLTGLVLNHWSIDEIKLHFKFTQPELTKLLIKLESMQLIELFPNNRIKLKTARRFRWNKGGPIETYIFDSMLKAFFNEPFDNKGETLTIINGMLSVKSIHKLQDMIEEVNEKFALLIEDDLKLPMSQKASTFLICALKPWDLPLLKTFNRKDMKKDIFHHEA